MKTRKECESETAEPRANGRAPAPICSQLALPSLELVFKKSGQWERLSQGRKWSRRLGARPRAGENEAGKKLTRARPRRILPARDATPAPPQKETAFRPQMRRRKDAIKIPPSFPHELSSANTDPNE